MFTLGNYTKEERETVAAACGTKPEYLYQCAKGIRSPGTKLSMKLMQHDSRLTIEGLLLPKLRRDVLREKGKLLLRPYRKAKARKSQIKV